ncbi:myoneurin-like isoform X1 [Carassius auratus]|uniref:Myoneurin-like isoform X1 n=3 Tax=Carassius auratus TaxID=7957 RepID=A0A6P6MAF5_CARAU|nr:myoneurin-like isoform X1 [Carassius auratus]
MLSGFWVWFKPLYIYVRLLLFHVMPHITHSEFLLEQLKRQRERSFLCDCTVTIGQSQYHAHHNVLAAFSEYFSTQSIDAGKENATIALDAELVSGAVFEKLLTYIYTGDLSMDREEIENVQKAASYLGMPEVVARCTLTQDDMKIDGSPTRQAEYEDPRSPLSPDDYEPLEPIAEVEERERLKVKKEDRVQDDESHSSSEQTPQRSGSKRGRKPKTRLYEVERETITAHRGRGRGQGRPRGRPRVRPLTSDSTEQSPAQQTMSPNSSSVGRGTGRPRGRPRVRPQSTDRDDSGNPEDESVAAKDQEESSAHKRGRPRIRPLSSGAEGDAQETEVVEEDSVNASEEDDGQVKTDVENPDRGPLKRGRGRPRTKPLTTENQTTNTENATTNTEDGSEAAKTKENEGTGRKRGRPRSKPLSSEAPESSNPTDKVENSGEEASGETNQDSEKHTEEGSSQCTEDSESNPAKKVRTSNRKRSLSRKLKESQASDEEEEDEELEDDNEDWGGEEEAKPLQDKQRPICNVCGNFFSEMSSLRRHMRIHKGLKPYQCQLCTRSFRQGNQLKTHMRIHTGEKPFSCTSCEARFAQKCQLVYHCRMHHGEEKPHKCDFCEAAFATSSNLKIHIRKHSGEKPYECGECGKRFTQASTLMYHKRRHTGEKPYICDTCGMAFAVSSSLIAHSRKHTGVTPYICLDCGKPCLTAGELRKHMDIHNGSRKVRCFLCGDMFSDMYSLKKHSVLEHNALPNQEQAPLETDPTQCPLNIPIDHQGLIARVRSALVDSQDHEIQMESPLPILSPETSLIIQQSAEPQMIIQHADCTEPSMIFQHADSSEAPVLIQHGESGEQVSYVVEQYEIPGNAEMEHTQIVIVQTID